MLRQPATWLVLLGITPLVAACGLAAGADTCDRDLGEILMFATAVDNGGTMRAEVELRDGSVLAEPLSLCKSDDLRILATAPEEVEHGGRIVYAVTLEVEDSSRNIDVEYDRDGDRIAFTLGLPASFEVTSPLADSDVPRSEDYTLAWNPPNPGGEMHIGVLEEIGFGVCLTTEVESHTYKDPEGVAVDDDGNWVVPADTISGATRDRCDATYWFTRQNEAAYPDALYPGGALVAQTTRSIAFTSVP